MWSVEYAYICIIYLSIGRRVCCCWCVRVLYIHPHDATEGRACYEACLCRQVHCTMILCTELNWYGVAGNKKHTQTRRQCTKTKQTGRGIDRDFVPTANDNISFRENEYARAHFMFVCIRSTHNGTIHTSTSVSHCCVRADVSM